MMFGAAIAAASLYLAGLFWLAARRDRAAAGAQAHAREGAIGHPHERANG
jgi:hypothetical protein